MIVAGLTGSIAMGKSETARMFAARGIPVFDSDAAVHALYASGGDAVAPLRALAPAAVSEGGVDRARLATLVQADPGLLKKIEEIVHPLVKARQLAFLADAATRSDIAVLDIPLLFETGGDKRVDGIVVVSTDAKTQRERILARDGMTEDKLDAILARQLPDAEKRKRADFVVDTSHGIEPVRARIAEILVEAAKMPRRRA